MRIKRVLKGKRITDSLPRFYRPFSLAAQHITLKIGQLHAATVLLSMHETNPDLRKTLPVIMNALLGGRNS